jgi:hypothetical protein
MLGQTRIEVHRTWALSGTKAPFLTCLRTPAFLGEPASEAPSYAAREAESMPLLTDTRGLAWSGARPKLKPSLWGRVVSCAVCGCVYLRMLLSADI